MYAFLDDLDTQILIRKKMRNLRKLQYLEIGIFYQLPLTQMMQPRSLLRAPKLSIAFSRTLI